MKRVCPSFHSLGFALNPPSASLALNFSRPAYRSAAPAVIAYFRSSTTHMATPGPSSVRSQNFLSQSTNSSSAAAEYVEDSEPERVERRRKLEKTRGKKTRTKARPRPNSDTIELSDSDSVSHCSFQRPCPANNAPKILDAIDISGIIYL